MRVLLASLAAAAIGIAGWLLSDVDPAGPHGTAVASDPNPPEVATEKLVTASAARTTRPFHDDPIAAEIELGRWLFEDTRLSADGTVSCASCHDPSRSFTDERAEAIGIEGRLTGRNTPSLVAMKWIRNFPVPVSSTGRLGAVGLEERCLAPIENVNEMGSSIDAVVHTLDKDQNVRRIFDAVYGDGPRGVTRDRLGRALATFVRSLDPESSPYSAFLAGDETALSSDQERGLHVFTGAGQCAGCHSGDGLSDGLMHVVARADSKRVEWRGHVARAGSAGQYYPHGGAGGPIISQTLSLWDVARTKPYLRDGMAASLEEVVRLHVAELRAVAKDPATRRSIPHQLCSTKKPPCPEDLSTDQVAHLVAFLESLSPSS